MQSAQLSKYTQTLAFLSTPYSSVLPLSHVGCHYPTSLGNQRMLLRFRLSHSKPLTQSHPRPSHLTGNSHVA